MAGTEKPNTLHYGDCLDILQRMEAESVDLIYLDPPFNSKTNYNMLFGSEKGEDQAQVRAFVDTWYWRADHEDVYNGLMARGGTLGNTTEALMVILGRCGMMVYLLFMMERLIQMKRVLKKTGSIYLHCDPTASHYLKIVMDAVFGANMFRNEVIWCYRKWSISGKSFAKNHDIILFYSKTNKHTFDIQYLDLSPATIKRHGEMKQLNKFKDGKRINLDTDKNEKSKGTPMFDWWEVSIVNPNAKERLGYPTQKPLALLKRIIRASSNEGDVVLDPFCGCGTSVDAAEALGRRWIGIDISTLAIDVILERLSNVHGTAILDWIDVTGRPRDVPGAKKLFARNPFEFERWAVGVLRGRPNDKQRGDGADGTLRFPSQNKNRPNQHYFVKGGVTVTPYAYRVQWKRIGCHGVLASPHQQRG